jgi:hypothetical protein
MPPGFSGREPFVTWLGIPTNPIYLDPIQLSKNQRILFKGFAFATAIQGWKGRITREGASLSQH